MAIEVHDGIMTSGHLFNLNELDMACSSLSNSAITYLMRIDLSVFKLCSCVLADE
jgi:hypothetical protein